MLLSVFEEDEDAEMAAGIEPEENDTIRMTIDASPDRYLEIPGRDHGEHHDILREFLNSGWTEDKELKSRVQRAYSGSIGRWKETIDNRDVVHGKQKRVKQTPTIDGMNVEEFIKNNADPIWLHQNEMWEYIDIDEEDYECQE